uniref:Dolichyl-diphosphooligosaccharide--protein glycosyltransferase subunit KCP2 n=1 Tax=Steinernema glaseri TaxID=37863 RepID=A0A1I7YFI7_9BILA
MFDHVHSFLASLAAVAGIFGAQLFFRDSLISSQQGHLIAGALNSIMFVYMLSFWSNWQMTDKGNNHRDGLGAVAVCVLLASISAGLISGVSVTVCIILSAMFAYFLHEATRTRTAGAANAVAAAAGGKKKK